MEGAWSKKVIVTEVIENRFTVTFSEDERVWLITLIRQGQKRMANDIRGFSPDEFRDASQVAREFLTTLGVTP